MNAQFAAALSAVRSECAETLAGLTALRLTHTAALAHASELEASVAETKAELKDSQRETKRAREECEAAAVAARQQEATRAFVRRRMDAEERRAAAARGGR